MRVNFYACGPTTYDMAHLGHARVYVVVDCMRRALAYLGHDVRYAMNITDVDDKIIAKGGAHGWRAVARRFEEEFWRDMRALHVRKPDVLLRATECIPEMIEFIEGIVLNGFAYESNGSVYFSVRAYLDAGYDKPAFAPTVNEEEADGDASNLDKRGARDFALWKAASEPGEPSFESPWGRGRPGWHIECSAMNRAAFGDGVPIHLHAGGVDLAFPHHTNEVLQGTAFYGGRSPFETFLHVGHLHIDGCKMSKSLKNFRTIRSLLESGVPADVLRVAMLIGTPWERPMEFDEQMFAQASAALRTVDSYLSQHAQPAPMERGDAPLDEKGRIASIAALLDGNKFKFHALLHRAVEAARSGDAANVPFVRHALRIVGVPEPQPVTDAAALALVAYRHRARMALRRNEEPRRDGAPDDAPPPGSGRKQWYAFLDRVRDEQLRAAGVTVEDACADGAYACWKSRT